MAQLFFRNLRLLFLAIFLIVAWGTVTFQSLPRLEDPELTSRFALVTTFLPGGTAERTESLVTDPVEAKIAEIPEVKSYESTSRAGVSTISVDLLDNVGKNRVPLVWSRVRDKLREVQGELPREASEPKLDEGEVRAYALLAALTWEQSDAPNYAILQRRAEVLKNALRSLSGTDEVEIFGAPQEEITVNVNTETLASLGITASELAGQIQQSDAKTSAGQFRGDNTLLYEVQGELDTLNRLQQIPVRCSNCESNREFRLLADIATIEKGIATPPTELAFTAGKAAIAVGVYVQSQYRLDRWAVDAQKTIDSFRADLPKGIQLEIVFDQSRYVTARLNNLIGNLLSGALMLFVICIIMMGWQQALAVQMALPLSVAIALIVMGLLGIPLHQMSVTGLIVALGILVDNAIILVDEMNIRLKAGMSLETAITETVQYLRAPLLGGTLTTVFSFAPIALLPGATGEFVGTIGLNVIVAVLASLLVALTISPAITAKIYQWNHRRSFTSKGAIGKQRWWESGFSHPGLTDWYRCSLQWSLRYPKRAIALTLILPVMGFTLMTTLSLQFFPAADREQFIVELELAPASSLGQIEQLTQEVEVKLRSHSEVQKVYWFLGKSAPKVYYNQLTNRENESSFAGAIVQINGIAGDRFIRKLQTEFNSAFPNARALVRLFEQGPPFEAPIELRIYGSDVDRLQQLSGEIRAVLAEVPTITHIRTRLNDVLPQLALDIDEPEARSRGLSRREIAEQLQIITEGLNGGTILEDTEEVPVRVRLSNSDRADLSQLQSVNLLPSDSEALRRNRNGYIPLETVGKLNLIPKNAAITRNNGRRVSTVQGYLTAGTLPANALADFRQRLQKSFSLPQGYSLEFGGEEAERNSATGGLLGYAIVLGIALVVTLVLSMNSFALAGLIGIVAILAIGLGGLSVWLFGYPFGFNPIIGTVGLIGVAVNDSITVLTALKSDTLAQTGDRSAMVETVIHTTRHVLTTTFTTMAGFIPLILGGGGFWPPLAVVIAGGVGGATILALYFIPSAYLLLPSAKPRRSR
ncbi:efflux RND transporter permease subunit [Nodularia sphaerocarpa]|uniref:efflux RND transporter permease subunit n=1 Tax=Nodularia sphaerocarpa TaxID=137816 RepID=UPI001EFA423C|nr:efflux RND transporter permease subunit [Nodularia sphaerocarpa]MDB9372078.1 efflux RND transporter permease subunit [Nodularia sphaerocarpa CS-585]MDB9376520.1 efflux RND transporter permease subunit [Nodularia sphaerocarpa CS-585A2]ULP74806.1 Cobalt-zinc-cadmium resistance protein CzcA [Nodularia sphaerocarpa UHCC 0038]